MIDPKELRIGDWIMYIQEEEPEFFKTDQERYLCITPLNIDSAVRSPEFYDPIPLTPEILEKCGFIENKKHRYCYFTNESIKSDRLHASAFCMIPIGDKGYYYAEYETENSEYEILDYAQPLKHLHQLQNFVFFMTGHELEIKL